VSKAIEIMITVSKNPDKFYTEENRMAMIKILADVFREITPLVKEYEEHTFQNSKLSQCARDLRVIINEINGGLTHPTQILPRMKTVHKALIDIEAVMNMEKKKVGSLK